MPDILDFFLGCFFFGGTVIAGIFSISVFFLRGRDRQFLGYGLVILSGAFLFFFRRLILFLAPAAGFPISEIGMIGSVQCLTAGVLYAYLVFFRLPKGNPMKTTLLLMQLATLIGLAFTIAFFLTYRFYWILYPYLCLVALYALISLVFVVILVRRRRKSADWDKRQALFMLILMVYFCFLIATYIIWRDVPSALIVGLLYGALIFAFYFQGKILYADYLEQVALRADLEKQIRERTAQLEDLHRKKQQFFINFTHEAKTPLTLILSYLDQYMKSAPPHRDLEVIKRNLGKLQADMQNYLEFEKLASDQDHFDHEQDTDAAWLLREKLILFQPIAGKKDVRLREKIPESVILRADPAAIDKIISNLIDNALKYTEPGGQVEAELSQKGKTVSLIVRDTGIGIPPEHREHVFEPFYQAGRKKSGAQGVGMGLHIVRQIVEEMGGEIAIRSGAPQRPKKNATAWVTEISVRLKCAGAARAHAQAAAGDYRLAPPVDLSAPAEAALPPLPATGRATLLVVEDNPELRRLLVTSLGRNYRVFGAANGAEALRLLETSPKPDVVISDIMMDVMDGYEFFGELKKRPLLHDVPVIFLTAVSSPLEKIRSLAEGVIDFITKPLSSVDELDAKIRSLLAFLGRKMKAVKDETFDRLIQAVADERGRLQGQEERLRNNMASFDLTQREQRIIGCLREGLQNKEIGARLGIATRTIDNHLYNIYKKTGCQNRMELLNKLLG